MPKGSNKMENKNEDQFIRMKEEIENNKQEFKTKLKDMKETLMKLMMDHTNKLTTLMKDQTNKKASTLEGEISENIGGMWTLKHEISSSRFYELLIKIELKGDTTLYLKNLYNHVKMSLNAVNRLKVDLLPD